MKDPYLPLTAQIIERKQESPTIVTLNTQFVDPPSRFQFSPGQFNMLYLYGVGEVPISIASDPAEDNFLSHTIRTVGRVTKAMNTLKENDTIGIRGPYGRGWPVDRAKGRDVLIITGGLGCAPTVSLVRYILARRKYFGSLKILQGVKHSEDFIYRKQYKTWQEASDTEVHIAADQARSNWAWHKGYVTDLIDTLILNPKKTIVMMCGPEMMMRAAVKTLRNKLISEDDIYLSMERNMECAIGHCGHCQYGGLFICKDGPVFSYPEVKALFNKKGF
ncbi:FAD/NAD(P)-binding protein [Legionella yabuuchiae]|uniref:FAD/NAD(P)-binding protein n=1 Tax=Legionella yabuuchiae TaxID=376727 RepID=UPI0010545886|nr:FAD/NAD(P)-binding protein [Legionella yabuuchiae]